MSDYALLWSVRLRDEHRNTGRTQHFVAGELAQRPTQLRIVNYPENEGFYLLHLDDAANEITDTYHATAAEAMSQAEWEFGVPPSEWTSIEPTQ